MRIKESVTPSGVAFSVRNLIGLDQELLSKVNADGTGDTSSFNKMLAGALQSLGNKSDSEINEKDVKRMLSNDRKFILVVLRQHSLKYQEEFAFNYEWPMEEGERNKLMQEYVVKFTDDNFPVVPYQWVREKVEEIMLIINNLEKDDLEKRDAQLEHIKELGHVPGPEGEIDKPDGHRIPFPKMYDSYKEMLDEHREVSGTFPEGGGEYKWNLMDGEQETKFAKLRQKDIHANIPLLMHSPKVRMAPGGSELGNDKDLWAQWDIRRADLLDVEHIRLHIKEYEGKVDTSLTIQHPNNPMKEKTLDLVSLPVFFFPSQAL